METTETPAEIMRRDKQALTDDNPQHTPGPWVIDQMGTDPDDVSVLAPDPSGEGTFALAGSWSFPLSEANARLIAAAPQLLAALEALQKRLHEYVKLDVKKHYGLMVADAAASTAIKAAREGA